ncbi:glyoxal reductase-like [Ambystoma mexicanum]|uniref:glyoxal reductase-like n=1 Tax=Ambystoma mexicanum TaxID=8296 RepID=UPI0037E817CA
MQSVTLNNGVQMPQVGLGTFRIIGYNTIYSTLDAALRCGYRSFDTAAVYGNEADIGQALKELLPRHGLTRQDIFLTSKLAPRDHGEDAERAALHSLHALDCDYLDLYLIHWPGKQGWKSDDPRNPECRRQSWVALEKLNKAGSLRTIGVSNYTEGHLKELLGNCQVRPAVLQVEYHPELAQRDLLRFCQMAGVQLQAYTSLGSGQLVDRKEVRAVAAKCGRQPSQVLLRWALQQGIGVIPKSTHPERIMENFCLFDFELSPQEIEELDTLNCDKRYCWDPSGVA